MTQSHTPETTVVAYAPTDGWEFFPRSLAQRLQWWTQTTVPPEAVPYDPSGFVYDPSPWFPEGGEHDPLPEADQRVNHERNARVRFVYQFVFAGPVTPTDLDTVRAALLADWVTTVTPKVNTVDAEA